MVNCGGGLFPGHHFPYDSRRLMAQAIKRNCVVAFLDTPSCSVSELLVGYDPSVGAGEMVPRAVPPCQHAGFGVIRKALMEVRCWGQWFSFGHVPFYRAWGIG